MSPIIPTHDSAYMLRQTNVSSPSVIHRERSQQSITASEDYYSLSGGSDQDPTDRARSQQTIIRYQTPPSRYRTPAQSRDNLPQQHEHSEEQQPQFRKTPMRGEGRRRSSAGEGPSAPLIGATPSAPAQAQIRQGGVRRKPVPSVVMENRSSQPPSEEEIDAQNARSSVAQDLDHQRSPPTPGIDDAPFIRFALDQLTRDEEVRGSRRYAGLGSGVEGNYPYVAPAEYPRPLQPMQRLPAQQGAPIQQYEKVPQDAPLDAPQDAPQDEDSDDSYHSYGQPPPRSPHRPVQPARALDQEVRPHPQLPPSPPGVRPEGPNLFIPVSVKEARQPALRFLPGTLRPLQLGIFTFLVLAFLICLIIAAVWSRTNTGLTNYGSFGDGRYFVFRYLPALFGVALLAWLVQIQIAVYRIAPFIAMSSSSAQSRVEGARLPLQPKSFVLPYFGHFKARLPIAGVFMTIAWLQLFTIPLLAASFNVWNVSGAGFRWIATQGAIWTVIALYILLLASLAALLIWLMRSTTGLKWDPTSLADMIVLLERSNALDDSGDSASAQLGYWRTTHRPNETLHSYAVADKPARSYVVEDGQIREKVAEKAQRFSSDPDADLEAGHRPERWSKQHMLPGSPDSDAKPGAALPWFLKPFFALLWPIVAIVLLLALLIVSYLPSTRVSQGFAPMLPAFVDGLGFSSTEFLYSFLPALLGLICWLGWSDVDMAYRRLQPFATLLSPPATDEASHSIEKASAADEGATAERSLLTTYPSSLPVHVTLTALANAHYRIALTSFLSLTSLALPILGAGVFWPQFDIPTQSTRVWAHLPGYYALTFFVVLNTLGWCAVYPPASLRRALLPREVGSFNGMRALVARSRVLDDVAFRAPAGRTVLVTRLLASSAAAPVGLGSREVGASKISLADSLRGFGRARAAAAGSGVGSAGGRGGVQRFSLGRHAGRDGYEFWGIGRVQG